MNETQVTPFGKYELLERLGAGGMAIVYRARYTAAPGITKPVVIKRVLSHYAEDTAFVEMFIQEARITVGLNHGNIVQVFDFGQVDGEYFLAMELVDGQPLSRVLKKAQALGLGQLPPPLAVSITIEMCKGLHHAHTRKDERGRPLGLVHRDISPDNVLVSYEGEVKISDFGIAKAQLAGRPVTEAGMVKGKYPYLSPEQARGQDDLDARSDVYAVGVVLYLMLCGRLPAEGHELSVLQRVIQGQLTPPLQLNPDLDGGLVQILQDALAHDRGARIPSAEALHQQLSHWLATRAPLFPVHSLKHLMGLLYEAELTAMDRAPQLPEKFREQVELWTSSQKRVVPQVGSPARTPMSPGPSEPGPERREPRRSQSGPQHTMAAPPATQARPSPARAASATRAAPPTRAAPVTSAQASEPEAGYPQTEELPAQTDRLPAQTEKLPAQTDRMQAVEGEDDDDDDTTGLVPPPRRRREQRVRPAPEDATEAADLPAVLRTQHFWLWILGAVCVTALMIKLTMSFLLTVPPLEVHSQPPGALVRVDGVVKGVTPLTVQGVARKEPHTVELVLPGMKAWSQSFDPGTLEEKLRVTLEPQPSAPPAQPAQPAQAAQQKSPTPSPAAPESFATRFGTEKLPARFTLQEKWHSFSATARSLREPLEARRTYSVWLSGSYVGEAPISEKDLQQGLTPDSVRSSQVYAFLEGASLAPEDQLFMVTARPRVLPSARALHVFVLVGTSSERNVDRDLTLFVRDNTSKQVVKRRLETKRFAHLLALENRYSVRQLDPDASYTLEILPHEGAPASAAAVLAVPRFGGKVQLSGQPAGELRYVLASGRYTVQGARELWFALPRWEGDGNAEMDVSLGAGEASEPEPAAPVESD
ncbi:serine/threonine-protein kinase [Hyalangium gracile]|uniref:serine/threonine-protein kinase n=1 Tax=Hyalangium gracile TaxID=394092 RepID=UPI001CCFC0B6|nr:serine/threonine-protein kinase [Hyalangium gracile]